MEELDVKIKYFEDKIKLLNKEIKMIDLDLETKKREISELRVIYNENVKIVNRTNFKSMLDFFIVICTFILSLITNIYINEVLANHITANINKLIIIFLKLYSILIPFDSLNFYLDELSLKGEDNFENIDKLIRDMGVNLSWLELSSSNLTEIKKDKNNLINKYIKVMNCIYIQKEILETSYIESLRYNYKILKNNTK